MNKTDISQNSCRRYYSTSTQLFNTNIHQYHTHRKLGYSPYSGNFQLLSPFQKSNRILHICLICSHGMITRSDMLQVHDGVNGYAPVVATLCGKKAAPITTTGRAVYMRFRTNAANNFRGFNISWESMLPFIFSKCFIIAYILKLVRNGNMYPKQTELVLCYMFEYGWGERGVSSCTRLGAFIIVYHVCMDPSHYLIR